MYPHTPLAAIAAREPERLVGANDPSFLTPVVYSSPLPPRELARRLDQELRDLPNVSRVGVAYRSGLTTLSDAYRAALSQNGKHSWDDILERAAHDDTQRKPAETIAACLQVALWHGRYDLASVRGRAPASGRHPAGDVPRATPLRPPRVRRPRPGRQS